MPISDVVRLSRHAGQYLAVFEGARPVGLYHGRDRRLASVEQRLVLHASERGCTFPGCSRGGYFAQVHHRDYDWVDGCPTNIDELTLACDVHHPLVGPLPEQWKTRRNEFGVTEWIPPVGYRPGRKPRVNWYHHPERRFTN